MIVIHPWKKELLTCKGGSKRCEQLKQGKETKMRDAILENVVREDLFERTSHKEGFGEGNSPGKSVQGSGNCKFKDPKAGIHMLQEK